MRNLKTDHEFFFFFFFFPTPPLGQDMTQGPAMGK